MQDPRVQQRQSCNAMGKDHPGAPRLPTRHHQFAALMKELEATFILQDVGDGAGPE